MNCCWTSSVCSAMLGCVLLRALSRTTLSDTFAT